MSTTRDNRKPTMLLINAYRLHAGLYSDKVPTILTIENIREFESSGFIQYIEELEKMNPLLVSPDGKNAFEYEAKNIL